LRARPKTSQGNQREAICYGGFFDFNRARPGKRGMVPKFPPILDRLTDALIHSGYLPSHVRPDSCIINQYNVGDCIPPHTDHPSYYRPISTLSLLGEEPMLVGSRFRTVKSCTWAANGSTSTSVLLPRRSLLVLGGNSGNIAKHCISACQTRRISITLRKQPPVGWKPDASELVGHGGKRRHEQVERKKGKSLSGSAKRRKRMQKNMLSSKGMGGSGGGSSGGGSSGIDQRRHASSSSLSSSSGMMFSLPTNNLSKKERKQLVTAEKARKKKEKQARRNQRRLAKKQEEPTKE
jgi:hypothetical protein